ncbi:uncharacterized protein ColSpa_10020 [Colletotrichum spaethianum]|uniref:Uncharacterized protein n=1 Tax=Colletotrichum spaethianum TaxID=700344 RepID=A0AA37PCT9_9PEZI|nr:uncharacterized protein ColSpa_10020 [Colletotrichum spaethianum]GKT49839.1 hypothetical protein ColSpa_10020 [Colletotrichum spaethianum]
MVRFWKRSRRRMSVDVSLYSVSGLSMDPAYGRGGGTKRGRNADGDVAVRAWAFRTDGAAGVLICDGVAMFKSTLNATSTERAAAVDVVP